jgi:hypothetical protein
MRKIITEGFLGDFNLPEGAREHLTASGTPPKPVADTVGEPVKPIEPVEPTTGPAKPEPTPEPLWNLPSRQKPHPLLSLPRLLRSHL